MNDVNQAKSLIAKAFVALGKSNNPNYYKVQNQLSNAVKSLNDLESQAKPAQLAG